MYPVPRPPTSLIQYCTKEDEMKEGDFFSNTSAVIKIKFKFRNKEPPLQFKPENNT